MEMKIFSALKRSAREIKRDIVVVYFAARDPRTSWWLRIFALLVAAYVLSPIDLIPDFIPVVGYLDDLILVPLAIRLLLHLLPAEVLAGARVKAEATPQWPRSIVAAVVVVLVWVVLAAWLIVGLL
jgi:uncharacterized membrane protein YkvA (DUF1232 family)